MKKILAKRWVRLSAMAAVVALGAALYLFQPWLLWVDQRVDETLPQPAAESESAQEADSSRQPVSLAAGDFVSQEHGTTGSAELIEQPDGSRVLAIADLDTSNGPDLRIWLSDQEVKADEWFVFDDGFHVELGELKGNQGNQVYQIPPEVDLDRVSSVSIWCVRFSVSFGAAELV